jgi:hypothetical protein
MATAEEKRDCAHRELKQRERVYTRWVLEGKMTQQLADRQIGLMREIMMDYEALASKDRLI